MKALHSRTATASMHGCQLAEQMEYDGDLDDEWIEDEGNPEDELLVCPACRADVHEDTQQCPYCGDWITPVYPAEASRRRIGMVVTLLLILGLVMLAII